MALLTPLAKARGLGSAKEGAHHWWIQRMTALLLIPLSLWFIVSLMMLLPMDYHAVVSWFSSPLTALGMMLMVMAMLYHGALGLQVVIEDYVRCTALQMGSIIVIKLLFLALTVIGVLSIVTLHLSSYTG